MKRVFFVLMASMVSVIALANVAFACGFFGHEPEVPASLR